ncbi:N-acetylglucosamine kinase [Lysinibacillus fusiformis]|uniref:N-acetylglucosamine kinase n=1 Tax=Lysinibacillus fusiformis TaxID=28031 RepID=UPI0023A95BEF|nr:ROK family protein [Lysinibacillus fusiformis]WEA38108.1 ROK family protein [Lysinibacillus fusiformis]
MSHQSLFLYEKGYGVMYVLAIDGGGTKTTAVICDEKGQCFAQIQTTRSNPTAMDQPYFEATIHSIMQSLQQQNHQIVAEITSCFAGMAGVKELQAESIVESILRQYVCSSASITVDNDALIALYAGTLGKAGIVQIAGTGAITMGYDKQQHFHRVGGWGYLFDDEGSGYDLGVQLLKAVLQSYDGRAPSTILTEAVLKHFSVEHVPQLIASVYGEEHPRTVIAPLSAYIVAAADDGDLVAKRIIEEACQNYFKAIKACYLRMVWRQEEVPVVLSGGVFTHENYFVPRLQAMAMQETLPFRFKTPALPLIGGAVIAALQQMNVQFSSSFVETFQKNYV